MTNSTNYKIREPASIIIHDVKNDPIFEVSAQGEVIWHKPEQASEAAEIFCKNLQLGIEKKAGIKQTRKEWAEEHRKSIREALVNGELTEEKLETIFNTIDFYGKLKGNETK